jgi:uncharacterized caspase-like protein
MFIFRLSKLSFAQLAIFLLLCCPVNSYAQRSGRLYAVCVGVSEYAQPSANLKYPRQDAQDVYELLRYHAAAPNLVLLTDHQATANNVLSQLNALFAQARPQDIVILYFSGHGTSGYFSAHDQAVSFRSLQAIFKKTQARRKVIFADACYSGTLRTEKPPDDDNDDTGGAHAGEDVLLFLSSRSNQMSRESSALNNGVFTHFLVAGLKGGADANRDRVIAAKELFNFVNANVRQHSKNVQVPVMWGKFDDSMPVLTWSKEQ